MASSTRAGRHVRPPQREDGPYEVLARLSVFLLQGDETEKGGGRGREQRKVLLPHIQIYPGTVFPNVQDLFMSVSISASRLRGAASTPRLCVATDARKPNCLRLRRDYNADYRVTSKTDRVNDRR